MNFPTWRMAARRTTAPRGIAGPPVWLPLLLLAGLIVSPLLLLLVPVRSFAHPRRFAFVPGGAASRAPRGGGFTPAPPRSPPL